MHLFEEAYNKANRLREAGNNVSILGPYSEDDKYGVTIRVSMGPNGTFNGVAWCSNGQLLIKDVEKDELVEESSKMYSKLFNYLWHENYLLKNRSTNGYEFVRLD